MAKTSIDTKQEIIVGDDSKRIRLFLVDGDDNDVKVAVASVKVFITEENTGSTINNRDGTTNTDGITIDQTNRVTFLMDALDNVIADTTNSPTYEYHWVKFEITYGSRMRAIRRRFKIIDA